MTLTIEFGDDGSADAGLVGGKAVNLARLTGAGFTVPAGYTVTTDAYAAFIEANDLTQSIADVLVQVDYTDNAALEEKTAAIRALIVAADVPPALNAAVTEAYRKLGDNRLVAVRSSATAEDLADTSFAGQHDTYLDIRGEDALLDAVRRCWASMWTARATGYRQQNAIEHREVGVAVVVQVMVEPEVAGVMFTANPVSGAVDEVVVNASWGLGESVVSGMVTPDTFVISRNGFHVKNREVGAKHVRIVRDSVRGSGTVTEEVPQAERDVPTLSDSQLAQLARLGLRVQEYYEGFPQDIEWAYADGGFYLLQSRPVTGIELSWDEDLDDQLNGMYGVQPPAADDTVWTRAWADWGWPGAVTPLFYSFRARMIARIYTELCTIWGTDAAKTVRPFKYHKGRPYYNADFDRLVYSEVVPSMLRENAATASVLQQMPETWHGKFAQESWSWTKLAKLMARIRMVDPDHGPYRCFENLYGQMEHNLDAAKGLSDEQIRELTDVDLKEYFETRITHQQDWCVDLWTVFFIFVPLAASAQLWMVENYYKGDNKLIINDLITGLPRPTITVKENNELFALADSIRGDERLTALFEQFEGRAFFDELRKREEGQEFVARYDRFLEEFGHRGHPQRDIYGDRRVENPSADYYHLQMLLATETARSPEEAAAELIERRELAEQEMIDSIRRQPFGSLKAEVFKTLQDFMMKAMLFRDDERWYTDLNTFGKKRAAVEIGRRVVERGLLEGDEFYFLSYHELCELLDGKGNVRLAKAKIAGRRRNWERAETWDAPKYIQNNRYVDLDHPAPSHEPGLFRGAAVSRGTVTGVARIVPTQADIGRVRQGEIIITDATDPGWTSVFLVVSAAVFQTGGMLAHCACISREYNIPAVHLPGAMRMIKDGSTITVDGDTGEVRVVSEPGDEPDAAAAATDGSTADVNATLAVG